MRDATRLLLLRCLDFDMQIPELPRRNQRRCFGHEIGPFGGFREGNDVTNARRAAQNSIEAVEPKSDTSMRRSTVLECFEHVTKPEPCLFRRNLENFLKHHLLNHRLVNSNRSAPELDAIDDHV